MCYFSTVVHQLVSQLEQLTDPHIISGNLPDAFLNQIDEIFVKIITNVANRIGCLESRLRFSLSHDFSVLFSLIKEDTRQPQKFSDDFGSKLIIDKQSAQEIIRFISLIYAWTDWRGSSCRNPDNSEFKRMTSMASSLLNFLPIIALTMGSQTAGGPTLDGSHILRSLSPSVLRLLNLDENQSQKERSRPKRCAILFDDLYSIGHEQILGLFTPYEKRSSCESDSMLNVLQHTLLRWLGSLHLVYEYLEELCIKLGGRQKLNRPGCLYGICKVAAASTDDGQEVYIILQFLLVLCGSIAGGLEILEKLGAYYFLSEIIQYESTPPSFLLISEGYIRRTKRFECQCQNSKGNACPLLEAEYLEGVILKNYEMYKSRYVLIKAHTTLCQSNSNGLELKAVAGHHLPKLVESQFPGNSLLAFAVDVYYNVVILSKEDDCTLDHLKQFYAISKDTLSRKRRPCQIQLMLAARFMIFISLYNTKSEVGVLVRKMESSRTVCKEITLELTKLTICEAKQKNSILATVSWLMWYLNVLSSFRGPETHERGIRNHASVMAEENIECAFELMLYYLDMPSLLRHLEDFLGPFLNKGLMTFSKSKEILQLQRVPYQDGRRPGLRIAVLFCNVAAELLAARQPIDGSFWESLRGQLIWLFFKQIVESVGTLLPRMSSPKLDEDFNIPELCTFLEDFLALLVSSGTQSNSESKLEVAVLFRATSDFYLDLAVAILSRGSLANRQSFSRDSSCSGKLGYTYVPKDVPSVDLEVREQAFASIILRAFRDLAERLSDIAYSILHNDSLDNDYLATKAERVYLAGHSLRQGFLRFLCFLLGFSLPNNVPDKIFLEPDRYPSSFMRHISNNEELRFVFVSASKTLFNLEILQVSILRKFKLAHSIFSYKTFWLEQFVWISWVIASQALNRKKRRISSFLYSSNRNGLWSHCWKKNFSGASSCCPSLKTVDQGKQHMPQPEVPHIPPLNEMDDAIRCRFMEVLYSSVLPNISLSASSQLRLDFRLNPVCFNCFSNEVLNAVDLFKFLNSLQESSAKTSGSEAKRHFMLDMNWATEPSKYSTWTTCFIERDGRLLQALFKEAKNTQMEGALKKALEGAFYRQVASSIDNLDSCNEAGICHFVMCKTCLTSRGQASAEDGKDGETSSMPMRYSCIIRRGTPKRSLLSSISTKCLCEAERKAPEDVRSQPYLKILIKYLRSLYIQDSASVFDTMTSKLPGLLLSLLCNAICEPHRRTLKSDNLSQLIRAAHSILASFSGDYFMPWIKPFLRAAINLMAEESNSKITSSPYSFTNASALLMVFAEWFSSLSNNSQATVNGVLLLTYFQLSMPQLIKPDNMMKLPKMPLSSLRLAVRALMQIGFSGGFSYDDDMFATSRRFCKQVFSNFNKKPNSIFDQFRNWIDEHEKGRNNDKTIWSVDSAVEHLTTPETQFRISEVHTLIERINSCIEEALLELESDDFNFENQESRSISNPLKMEVLLKTHRQEERIPINMNWLIDSCFNRINDFVAGPAPQYASGSSLATRCQPSASLKKVGDSSVFTKLVGALNILLLQSSTSCLLAEMVNHQTERNINIDVASHKICGLLSEIALCHVFDTQTHAIAFQLLGWSQMILSLDAVSGSLDSNEPPIIDKAFNNDFNRDQNRDCLSPFLVPWHRDLVQEAFESFDLPHQKISGQHDESFESRSLISLDCLLRIASHTPVAGPWLAKDVLTIQSEESDMHLLLLCRAVTSRITVLLFGASILAQAEIGVSTLVTQSKAINPAEGYTFEQQPYQEPLLPSCKADPEKCTSSLASCGFRSMYWWLVNLGLCLSRDAHLVDELVYNKFSRSVVQYVLRVKGNQGLVRLPCDRPRASKEAAELCMPAETKDSSVAITAVDLVGILITNYAFPDTNGFTFLELHSSSLNSFRSGRSSRGSLPKSSKEEYSDLESASSSATLFFSKLLTHWSEYLMAVVIVVAFNRFVCKLAWPSQDEEARFQESEIDLRRDRYYLLLAKRDILNTIVDYRLAMKQAISRAVHQRNTPDDLKTFVHSPAYCQLILLELLINDELQRRTTWLGMSRQWEVEAPSACELLGYTWLGPHATARYSNVSHESKFLASQTILSRIFLGKSNQNSTLLPLSGSGSSSRILYSKRLHGNNSIIVSWGTSGSNNLLNPAIDHITDISQDTSANNITLYTKDSNRENPAHTKSQIEQLIGGGAGRKQSPESESSPSSQGSPSPISRRDLRKRSRTNPALASSPWLEGRISHDFKPEKKSRVIRMYRTASPFLNSNESKMRMTRRQTIRMPIRVTSGPLSRHRARLSLPAIRVPDQMARIWHCLLRNAWSIAPPVVSQLLDRFSTKKTLIREARKFFASEPRSMLLYSLLWPDLNISLLNLAVSPTGTWIGTSRFLKHSQETNPAFEAIQSSSLCLPCRRSSMGESTREKKSRLSRRIKSLYPFYWIYLQHISAKTFIQLLHRKHRVDILLKNIGMMRVFKSHPVELTHLLIQELIQALDYDCGMIIENFLIDLCLAYTSISQSLLFLLSAEIQDTKTRGFMSSYLRPVICRRIISRLVSDSCLLLDERRRISFRHQFLFFDSLIQLSGDLIRVPSQKRNSMLNDSLMELAKTFNPETPLYLPTDFSLKIVKLLIDEAKLMQSASKTPFMLKFEVQECHPSRMLNTSRALKFVKVEHTMEVGTRYFEENWLSSERPLVKGLIFKSHDDIRQDQLALQIIEICQRLFDKANLPLKLHPYKVIPHRVIRAENRRSSNTNLGGIIEVVPDALSRHQIGRLHDCSLSDYFHRRFGKHVPIDGRADGRYCQCSFHKAQNRFLRSLAAYSVLSFLLQAKDRHNANLLITREGDIVHIDFGFIFDVSPGGDLKFEKAPFKLTSVVLGGSVQDPAFKAFEDLVIKGFLVVRQEAVLILQLVAILMESQLPCFKKSSLKNLRQRFQLKLTPDAAAAYMRQQIMTSYNALSTRLYDVVQSIQQGIAH